MRAWHVFCMKRPVETFDDPAAFRVAQRGTRTPRKSAQAARPEMPRAQAGHGDHLAALMRLSAAGWHSYAYQAGQHYFARLDGTLGPMGATYEEAISATEALTKQP